MKPYLRTLLHDSLIIVAVLLIALWARESFAAEPTKYQIQKREAKKAELAKWREIRRAREVKFEACLHQCRSTCK